MTKKEKKDLLYRDLTRRNDIYRAATSIRALIQDDKEMKYACSTMDDICRKMVRVGEWLVGAHHDFPYNFKIEDELDLTFFFLEQCKGHMPEQLRQGLIEDLEHYVVLFNDMRDKFRGKPAVDAQAETSGAANA